LFPFGFLFRSAQKFFTTLPPQAKEIILKVFISVLIVNRNLLSLLSKSSKTLNELVEWQIKISFCNISCGFVTIFLKIKPPGLRLVVLRDKASNNAS